VSNDPNPRSAGWIAALVALPVALVAGFVAFQVLKPTSTPPVASPSASVSPRVMPTAPVSVAASKLDDRQAAACRALIAALPEQIRDLPRRPVSAGPEQNAAYGDPAIVVTCGGAAPSFPPTDFVYPISGVCWHPDAGGNAWTTVDREVPVTVSLPPPLAGNGSGQWAAAFSPVVSTSVPASTARPTGCG
jgi:hypothetical protein